MTPGAPRSPRWRQCAPWLLAVPLAAVTLPACGTPHLGLSNGAVSACYRAIPTAEVAVHDASAHLVGVHRVPVDKAAAAVPTAVSSTSADDDTAVCAVVMHGNFAPGQVTLAPSHARGDYAVLLIAISDLKLLGATVVDHVPPGFGKRLT